MSNCLICLTPNAERSAGQNLLAFSCPRCGDWVLKAEHPEFEMMFRRKYNGEIPYSVRSRLSHFLRRRASQMEAGRYATMTLEELNRWSDDTARISPSQQIDDFILWVGDHQQSVPQYVSPPKPELAAWIGSELTEMNSERAFDWLVVRGGVSKWIEIAMLSTGEGYRLTLVGWDRYEALKRGRIESRNVLMAMQFGDAVLDAVVEQHFKPAVARTGFTLHTLTENQGAGLIDDQLRVALRTSRFVVADITHRNNGAYWEAGFAEGLGRPVIYTCREAEWKKQASHFDTAHLMTVIWTPDDLSKAEKQLTATIRATLPGEAIMLDG